MKESLSGITLAVLFGVTSISTVKEKQLYINDSIKVATTQELIEKTDLYRDMEIYDKTLKDFHLEVQRLKNAEIHDNK